MIISDLIYNDDLDANCNYAIFDGCWNDGGKCVWSTKENGYHKPLDELLDKKVRYITVHDNTLIIEYC